MRKFSVIAGIILASLGVKAQVSMNPVFATDEDSITITYDAAQGNKALIDLGPPIVYMHAGVITDKSETQTSWKYVQGKWGTADNNVVMKSIGNNLYQKKYHMRNFYNVPSNEEIKRLAFVFRNVDGSKVGRAFDGSDIFIEILDGFSLQVLAPVEKSQILKLNDKITIKAASSEVADLKIYLNGSVIEQANADTLIEHTYTATSSGNFEVRIEAIKGAVTIGDTIHFVVNPNRSLKDPVFPLPDGAEVASSNTTRFTLYAPNKDYVYLIGSFNNWQFDTAYMMHKTTDGNRFWIDLVGLNANKEYMYQYVVNGDLRIADPFSTQVLDPWSDLFIPSSTYPNLQSYPTGGTLDIISLFTAHPTKFKWNDSGFKAPSTDDLVIYELLLRDFIEAHDFQTLQDSLDYLQNLGINAIELMPVSEFEGNESWGYNPSFHMALDKYYGTPTAFKELVDECHKRGIAVILDVVYNHAFSQSPLCRLYWDAGNFRPHSTNPYMNVTAKHPFNVGYDINHESTATKYWLDRVNKYWVQEYHIDGFRYDLSKGFTQRNSGSDVGAWGNYDASRITLLKRMATEIRKYKSDAILILEHFSDDTEEKELGANGFLMWRNMNHTYAEAAMGYGSDLGWAAYNASGHNKADWVVYAESHDEERVMFKNTSFGNSSGNYNIKSRSTALDRMELVHAFLFGIPGPKLIWQFEELGYDVSIKENGRTGSKPILWGYFTNKDRKDLYDITSELIHLKTTYPSFKTQDFNLFVNDMTKVIRLNHSDMNVLIIGNFDVVYRDIDMRFQHTGKWYEYFSEDSMNVTNSNTKIAFAPGEYRIYTTRKIYRPGSDSSVGINKLVLNPLKLSVFPNPSMGSISIVNNSDKPFDGTMSISNIQQEVVYEKEMVLISKYQHKKLAPKLSAGVYLITLTDSDGSRSTIKHVVVD